MAVRNVKQVVGTDFPLVQGVLEDVGIVGSLVHPRAFPLVLSLVFVEDLKSGIIYSYIWRDYASVYCCKNIQALLLSWHDHLELLGKAIVF